ncbi:NDP-hexose 2,3-dehydratase family protein [Rhizomonospora bruguierae]|uniref:NDP-hexose 2,3-dehydratase family protein n=1 Tax=Rhizomonospora bruguierae TaxID=1581705 RepID=UPI001BCC1FEE|nr:NDP-hexose 2,3-dehydratase family protein [Micromonospora sp. NBRC 107566]
MTTLLTQRPASLAARLTASVCSAGKVSPGLDGYRSALRHDADRMWTRTTVKPLAELRDWSRTAGRSAIAHRSGGFFAVIGARMTMSGPGRTQTWDQPIISQPEVGLLGIIAHEFDGVLHFLMQNKAEPGNRNGIQLSPTVQATRSNFTRVHGGSAIPYLHHFLDPAAPAFRTLTDVRQSEHGSWFLRKRNRDVVIEVIDDIEVRDGFHWLTLGQIAELMQVDDMVNMETRSVLSCLPWFRTAEPQAAGDPAGFRAALDRSCDSVWGSAHSDTEIASWITRARSEHQVSVERVPLHRLSGWTDGPDRVARNDGRYFEVVGVDVEAGGREVRTWDQPMVSAGDNGVVALVVRQFDGVLHVLLQLRAEGGSADGPEIAPTVQCNPANYLADGPDGDRRPVLLDRVLSAPAGQIRYDTMLSDEGGRFFRISHRHLIVEADDIDAPPGFRWLTVHQIARLLQHSGYLNVQARSLMACLQSLLAEAP